MSRNRTSRRAPHHGCLGEGVVLDANVVAEIYRYAIDERNSDSSSLHSMETIAQKHGMVIHRMMKEEYKQTCDRYWIGEWVTRALSMGWMKLDEFGSVPRDMRDRLRIDFGLPKTSWDCYYMYAATRWCPHYVISDDVDFFDPKLKGRAESDRSVRKAKLERRGSLCRWLKREHGVTVGTIKHAQNEL